MVLSVPAPLHRRGGRWGPVLAAAGALPTARYFLLITNAYYGHCSGAVCEPPGQPRESLLVGPPAAAQLRGDTAEAAPLITRRCSGSASRPATKAMTSRHADGRRASRSGPSAAPGHTARRRRGGRGRYDLFTGNTLAEAHHEPAERTMALARPVRPGRGRAPCGLLARSRRGAGPRPARCHLLQDPWIHSHIQIYDSLRLVQENM